MSFTYQAAINSANVKLRNSSKAEWTDPDMLDLLNDAVQLMTHGLSIADPEQFHSSYVIPLLSATGYGPYNLPTEFKFDLWIDDDQTQPQRLAKINRGKSTHLVSTTRPYQYWLEGRRPTKIYFGQKPDQNRNFTLYYCPVVARAAIGGIEGNVPLEDYCFEPLVQALVKFAGQMDEYITMDEDQKLQAMMPYVMQITSVRANPLEISITGVGF